MELLFYWNKNDININDQLVLLSNRYSIDIKETENAINIDLTNNENFIDGFFGVNINNITALVGENGAGKSNLAYTLLSKITGYKYAHNETFIIGTYNEGKVTIYETISTSTDKKVEVKSELPHNILKPEINKDFDGNPSVNLKMMDHLNLIYYNPVYDFRDYPYDIEPREYADISSSYMMWQDFYNEKPDKSDESGKPDMAAVHRSEEIKRQFRITQWPLLKPELFREVKIPDKIGISLKNDLKGNLQGLNFELKELYKQLSNILHKSYEYHLKRKARKKEKHLLELSKVWILINFVDAYFYFLSKKYPIDLDIKYLDIDEVSREMEILKNETDLRDINANDFLSLINVFLTNQKLYSKPFLIENDLNKLFSIVDKNIKNLDYDSEPIYYLGKTDCFNFMNAFDYLIDRFNPKTYTSLIKASWRNISSGELAYLNLFSRLHHGYSSFYNEKNISNSIAIRDVFLILDEGDLTMHPNWQKKYLSIIIEFLNIYDTVKFQILLITHSPIMLSDLPKQNIIFLEKGSDKKTKVINPSDRDQTFGANIYSLYKDSFFMKDGFMGEFASSKINGLFKKIEGLDNPSKEIFIKLKKQIDLIGEPVLRNTLLRKLSDQLPIDNRIEELRKEIENLESKKYGQDRN